MVGQPGGGLYSRSVSLGGLHSWSVSLGVYRHCLVST